MGRKSRSGNPRKQARHARSYARLSKKKDRRVQKSSHGKFTSVEQLEAHRVAVSK